MPSEPTPILRALEGVADQSGRTVVIAGPPASGKSRLLEGIAAAIGSHGGRVIRLQGSYRARSVPYGALDGLRADPNAPSPIPSGGSEEDGGGPEPVLAGPMAPIAYDPERLPRRRRSRGDRPRASLLGVPVRSRSANEGDPDAFWRELLPEFDAAEPHPVAILVEDAAIFDGESREFLVALSRRARLRPLLIALTIDTTVAGASLWEEAFFGRSDVDWVRTAQSATDAREAAHLKELFENLPAPSQRLVGFVAMLGGSVGEVVLSRVARLTFSQLADALLPASGVGLLKIQESKVVMPHRAWVGLVPELLPELQRREMHLQIADALSALSPEPSLARRIEVARHYLAGATGRTALARLLEAAEICLQLVSFDEATNLLADAVACLPAIPAADRRSIEPEMRLLFAQALFFSGRVSEAETQVQEGIDGAIESKVSSTELSEWVEPLLLTLRAIGPRPSLTTTLVELAERCHEAGLVEVEVLLETLIADFHRERGLTERAQAEALRAAALARRLPERHLQALGLLAIGFSRIEGSEADRRLAERFLSAARILLGKARRWELDYLAADFEAQLIEALGNTARARAFREQSITTLQRERLPAAELYHDLGIAEVLLDQGITKGRETYLARARAIVENLHLLPPSPGLLRSWLLDGRQLALGGSVDAARDRWEAIVALPAARSLPRIRSEAMVRLALLDFAVGRTEEGRQLATQLASFELVAALPRSWQRWVGDLERMAPDSERGGGRLPPGPPPPAKPGGGAQPSKATRP